MLATGPEGRTSSGQLSSVRAGYPASTTSRLYRRPAPSLVLGHPAGGRPTQDEVTDGRDHGPLRSRRWAARLRRGPAPAPRSSRGQRTRYLFSASPPGLRPGGAVTSRNRVVPGTGSNCEPRCSSGGGRPRSCSTSGDSWRQHLLPWTSGPARLPGGGNACAFSTGRDMPRIRIRRWRAAESGGDSPAREQLSALPSLLCAGHAADPAGQSGHHLEHGRERGRIARAMPVQGHLLRRRTAGCPSARPGAAAVSPLPAELVTAGLPPGGGQAELARAGGGGGPDQDHEPGPGPRLRRGQMAAQRAGAAPAASLRTWVEEVLGN